VEKRGSGTHLGVQKGGSRREFIVGCQSGGVLKGSRGGGVEQTSAMLSVGPLLGLGKNEYQREVDAHGGPTVWKIALCAKSDRIGLEN